MNAEEPTGGVAVETVTEEQTRHMPMYKVIMHNDDKTTMDFVVYVLQNIFNKKIEAAMQLMMEIHKTGCGLAGVYPLEHAELRVDTTHSLARAQKFPLQCSIEPAEE
jgi:ATP-dependent Clp protease adaptor protein ClpS